MAEGPTPADIPDDPLLKGVEVARILNINRATLASWVEQGLLPAVVLPSGVHRYRRPDIERILATAEGGAA